MQYKPQKHRGHAALPLLLALALGGASTLALAAEDLPRGDQLMESVDERDEGITQKSRIEFTLENRQGRSREQEAVILRRYNGDDKKQVLFYREPSNIRGTAFLTYDYADASRDDDQWLYLPAARKTRRISASDRGDYFLGTDLTYEDLKRQNKVSLDDWHFETVGTAQVDDIPVIVVEGTPVSEQVSQELGYSRARWYVDASTATIRKAENWDLQGNRLKTVRFEDLRKVQDIWTVHKILVENHKTGHSTRLKISGVEYGLDIADSAFDERALSRGLRY